ncbi:MAG: sugar/nucleoside kinase (ribokinase family) [Natronomonas sp.]|jgi:sugar/nucleoside kinase (ribokinase family)|uniref:PfkB family carbohydrate kinase n=1 Tax=Natronomonas sp. TaxID=2184060 RepID=UPI00398A03A2
MYGAVPSLVETDVRFAAFPDGSVDTYYRITDADRRWLTKAEFRERITGARSREFRAPQRIVDTGGQAVNAAEQAHALGDSVRLDGCLDDPRLTFPFETHSFGEPTRVDIHEFEDGDLTYATISDAVANWTHEAFDTVPSAEAYFCGNWASVDGMTESLAALADRLDEGIFVVDPGDVTTAARDALRDCCAALSALDDTLPVYVSLNGRELTAVADAFGVADEPGAVRPEIGVSGVVRHEEHAATAATRDTTLAVPNIGPKDPVRQTGGGDRFSAGLAHALAAGEELDLGDALALGNCCASYYALQGETGTSEELIEFAETYADI